MDPATHAFGSRLYVLADGGSPEDFVEVKRITSVKPGASTTAAIDTTELDSPGVHKQRIPGVRDTGAIAFAGNYQPDDPGQQRMAELQASRDVTTFRVAAPDALGSPAVTWEYTGFVSGFSIDDLNPNVPITFKGEITVSEAPDQGSPA
ncbi:MAG TPA: phage tail tube protein [Candidatus Dormibacteraeota bacterium]|nr:phage tail tube protein [Candidatus Dormibacteraeota bacterium]